MPRILVHESNHHVNIAARFQERSEDRVVLYRFVGHRWDQILQDVSSERELRKDNQLGLAGPCFLDETQVPLQVGFDFTEPGGYLYEG
jgi:hypothetical protein